MALPGALLMAVLSLLALATASIMPEEKFADSSLASRFLAPDNQPEWKMEATAYIASIVIKNMYCKLDYGAACDFHEPPDYHSLKAWAANDRGWERLVSSLSVFELARRFWHLRDYERAMVAAEQSLALKLYPYSQRGLLTRWQKALVRPGDAFSQQQVELAGTLTLRASCLAELGQAQGNVEYLYHALEAIHLAAALLHSSMGGLTAETYAQLEGVTAGIAGSLADILSSAKAARLQEVLDRMGIPCTACVERADQLSALINHMALPLQFGDPGGRRLEPLPDAFVPSAYLQTPEETQEQFMQRFFTQLVGMVSKKIYQDMNVNCTYYDQQGKCWSYLPDWVYEGEEEDYDWLLGTTGSTGASVGHVAAPSQSASSTPPKPAAPAAPPTPSSSTPPSSSASSGSSSSSSSSTSSSKVDKNQSSSGGSSKPGQQAKSSGGGGGSSKPAAPAPPSSEEALDARLADLHSLILDLESDIMQMFKRPLPPPHSGNGMAKVSNLFRKSANAGSGNAKMRADAEAAFASWSSIPSEPARLMQLCVQMGGETLAFCQEAFSVFDDLYHPPFPPPPVKYDTYMSKLPPLPFKPSPPPWPQEPGAAARASMRRQMPEGHCSVLPNGMTSCSPRSNPGPGGAQPGGRGANSAGSGLPPQPFPTFATSSEEERQMSDRHLQEQLTRLASGAGPFNRRDDPLMFLTLIGITVFSTLAYMVAKNRKRLHRYVANFSLIAGHGPDDAASALGVSSGSAEASSLLKKQVAAALRSAVTGTDVPRLAELVEQAEALGFDPAVLQRARQALQAKRKAAKTKGPAAAAKQPPSNVARKASSSSQQQSSSGSPSARSSSSHGGGDSATGPDISSGSSAALGKQQSGWFVNLWAVLLTGDGDAGEDAQQAKGGAGDAAAAQRQPSNPSLRNAAGTSREHDASSLAIDQGPFAKVPASALPLDGTASAAAAAGGSGAAPKQPSSASDCNDSAFGYDAWTDGLDEQYERRHGDGDEGWQQMEARRRRNAAKEKEKATAAAAAAAAAGAKPDGTPSAAAKVAKATTAVPAPKGGPSAQPPLFPPASSAPPANGSLPSLPAGLVPPQPISSPASWFNWFAGGGKPVLGMPFTPPPPPPPPRKPPGTPPAAAPPTAAASASSSSPGAAAAALWPAVPPPPPPKPSGAPAAIAAAAPGGAKAGKKPATPPAASAAAPTGIRQTMSAPIPITTSKPGATAASAPATTDRVVAAPNKSPRSLSSVMTAAPSLPPGASGQAPAAAAAGAAKGAAAQAKASSASRARAATAPAATAGGAPTSPAKAPPPVQQAQEQETVERPALMGALSHLIGRRDHFAQGLLDPTTGQPLQAMGGPSLSAGMDMGPVAPRGVPFPTGGNGPQSLGFQLGNGLQPLVGDHQQGLPSAGSGYSFTSQQQQGQQQRLLNLGGLQPSSAPPTTMADSLASSHSLGMEPLNMFSANSLWSTPASLAAPSLMPPTSLGGAATAATAASANSSVVWPVAGAAVGWDRLGLDGPVARQGNSGRLVSGGGGLLDGIGEYGQHGEYGGNNGEYGGVEYGNVEYGNEEEEMMLGGTQDGLPDINPWAADIMRNVVD